MTNIQIIELNKTILCIVTKRHYTYNDTIKQHNMLSKSLSRLVSISRFEIFYIALSKLFILILTYIFLLFLLCCYVKQQVCKKN